MKNKREKKSAFQKAVEATPDIESGFEPGLQAFEEKHRNKVSVPHTRSLEGSVDIEKHTKPKYPGSRQWDYAFAYRGEVFFIEVHGAQTSKVREVLEKLQWLKGWLDHEAPAIKRLIATSRFPYYWVQSGDFDIPKRTSQYKQLMEVGLMPVSKVELK